MDATSVTYRYNDHDYTQTQGTTDGTTDTDARVVALREELARERAERRWLLAVMEDTATRHWHLAPMRDMWCAIHDDSGGRPAWRE